MTELTPREIVAELDKYIVGQRQAKKSVAVALRNRWRSNQLHTDLKEEIIPKNILMIGPTGVGKTEIARRLAKLVNAPFVKVEATKFTEIGYVGRDVESIIRDLVETAIRMVKQEKMLAVNDKAATASNERLLEYFYPLPKKDTRHNPFDMQPPEPPEPNNMTREYWRQRLYNGELEEEMLEITVEDGSSPVMGMFAGSGIEEMGINIQDMLGTLLPRKQRQRKVNVATARRIFTMEEAQKMIDMDDVAATAVDLAENSGIIFLDEIDKIVGRSNSSGPDVSREGVQRDILPIVEGSTVMTKHGPVQTDRMLFISAGAFHMSKPSDLIPELQGRFPIRVELTSLSKDDFRQILTEPANALITQYVSLLATEGITIEFTEDAIDELAKIACQVNEQTEDIGARRLHTVMEKLLEDLSFEAPDTDIHHIVIDQEYVSNKLEHIVTNPDLSHFIL